MRTDGGVAGSVDRPRRCRLVPPRLPTETDVLADRDVLEGATTSTSCRPRPASTTPDRSRRPTPRCASTRSCSCRSTPLLRRPAHAVGAVAGQPPPPGQPGATRALAAVARSWVLGVVLAITVVADEVENFFTSRVIDEAWDGQPLDGAERPGRRRHRQVGRAAWCFRPVRHRRRPAAARRAAAGRCARRGSRSCCSSLLGRGRQHRPGRRGGAAVGRRPDRLEPARRRAAGRGRRGLRRRAASRSGARPITVRAQGRPLTFAALLRAALALAAGGRSSPSACLLAAGALQWRGLLVLAVVLAGAYLLSLPIRHFWELRADRRGARRCRRRRRPCATRSARCWPPSCRSSSGIAVVRATIGRRLLPPATARGSTATWCASCLGDRAGRRRQPRSRPSAVGAPAPLARRRRPGAALDPARRCCSRVVALPSGAHDPALDVAHRRPGPGVGGRRARLPERPDAHRRRCSTSSATARCAAAGPGTPSCRRRCGCSASSARRSSGCSCVWVVLALAARPGRLPRRPPAAARSGVNVADPLGQRGLRGLAGPPTRCRQHGRRSQPLRASWRPRAGDCGRPTGRRSCSTACSSATPDPTTGDPCGAQGRARHGRAAPGPARSPCRASSGGGLGLVTYDTHCRRRRHRRPSRRLVRPAASATTSSAPTVAWGLFRDTLATLLRPGGGRDRAAALERAWERPWRQDGDALAEPFLTGQAASRARCIFLNGYSIEDGCRLSTSVVLHRGRPPDRPVRRARPERSRPTTARS